MVKMARDPDQYPAPHEVEVHLAEVENYRAGGFVEVAEKPRKTKEAAK